MFEDVCQQLHPRLLAGKCPWCGQTIIVGVAWKWWFSEPCPADQHSCEGLIDRILRDVKSALLGDPQLFVARIALEELLATRCGSDHPVHRAECWIDCRLSSDRLVIQIGDELRDIPLAPA